MKGNVPLTPGSEPVILIPADFTEICENAVGYGIELASSLNYRACLLHVISMQEQEGQEAGQPESDRAYEKLKEYQSLFGKKNSEKIELLVRRGNILKVIRKTAVDLKAAMVVMGTHGKQGLQHLFGSYALKVVLDSPCPVLVIQRKSFGAGYQNIVLPLTSELETRHALQWVLLISRTFGSHVHILGAFEPEPSLKKRLELIAGQIEKALRDEGVSCQISLADGGEEFPGQVIEYATRVGSELIMMPMMPDVEIPGFNFLAWDEQLMFNHAQVPIMCVSPSGR
jgi:nucleotide-binding universal stress UspA family protein